MNRTPHRRTECPSVLHASVLLLVAITVAAPGCAELKMAIPKTQDITQERRRRHDQSVMRFRRYRDDAELEAARGKWVAGDVDGACDQLRHILERTPGHVDATLLLAELLLARDMPDEAARVLRPAANAHPDNAAVQYTMDLARGLSQFSRRENGAFPLSPRGLPQSSGRETEALSAAQANPVVATSLVGDPHVSLPSDLLSGHSSDNEAPAGSEHSGEGTGRSDSGGSNGSNDPDVLAIQASAAERAENFSLGKEGDSPIFAARKSGQSPDARKLGQSPAEFDDDREALAFYREAIAEDPRDPHIPISAAVMALRQNRPGLAVQLLEPAAEKFPRQAAIHRVLGVAYYRQGEFRSSQIALQQALSLDNSSALSYFLLGCTLAKLGQPESAEKHFQQARQIDPRFADPR